MEHKKYNNRYEVGQRWQDRRKVRVILEIIPAYGDKEVLISYREVTTLKNGGERTKYKQIRMSSFVNWVHRKSPTLINHY